MKTWKYVAGTFLFLAILLGGSPGDAFGKLKIVATLPDYAAIAKEVGGDLVEVRHIAELNQDPHFVSPKPSYSLMLREADLFVSTGLDLELWVPVVVDKSGNPAIREREEGYVSVSRGVNLLQKPQGTVTRAEGDIHIYGNPHIYTGPLNAVKIAENVLIGLKKISPENADYFTQRYHDFKERIYRALFGEELVDLVGGEKLSRIFEEGNLEDFLESEEMNTVVDGTPLRDRLGGWLAKAMPLVGQKIVCYHNSWIYFTTTFGLEIAGYVEPKPGIPPSAKHVRAITELIERERIKAVLVEKYFEESTPRKIEEKTGAKMVRVTMDVGGEPGVDDYVALVDFWIERLLAVMG
jgi:ABC-type Zn uptake system ZnuABC Zn-binding protein ZnuA